MARPPKFTRPAESAAGVPGVAHALKAAVGSMGPLRAGRTLLRVNQPDGFDCPGCAWPDPHDTSTAEFCENGAKAVASEATEARVSRAFFADHPLDTLATWDDKALGDLGRLTEPMVRRAGSDRYEPISWDEAFSLVGSTLRSLDDPDRAVFYTSGRTSNEAAFLYQLFVRAFGTNNLPDCSNMCHESSGVALGETLGIGKGTVTLADVETSSLVIVVGQNPGTNHPRMLSALQRTKANGGRIIAVNPMPEAGLLAFRNPQQVRGWVGPATPLADLHLQVRNGGDLALFAALNATLVADDSTTTPTLDHEFIDAHTDGIDELVGHLSELDGDALCKDAGIAPAELRRLADEVERAPSIIVCWAMGLTQHRDSVPTIREVVNFLLLRGNIGRPGAGACPVRGHSNVQGDRTMGIHERPSEQLLDALDAEFSIVTPRRPGHSTVEAIAALEAGDAEVFVAVGGNLASAAPDTARTEAALASAGLTVSVSTTLNRTHVAAGSTSLILPCLGRTERDEQATGPQRVTVEDSMGQVHASSGTLPPAGPDLRSEVAIISGLAAATLPATPSLDWDAWTSDYRLVRRHIERVIPGFDGFEQRIDEPGGFALPNGPRDDRTFATVSGRAGFTVNEPTPLELPVGALLLQTLRSHDQFNTTIHGLDDRYRGVRGERRVVFTHPDEVEALGLADGDIVDLVSNDGDVERRAEGFRVVAYPIARRTCAAYFPEANPVIPLESVADRSLTPTSKAIVIRLDRSRRGD